MPELPELEVVCDVLNHSILGQTIISAEVIPPGGPNVVRDLTGDGFTAGMGPAVVEITLKELTGRRGISHLRFAHPQSEGPTE